MNLDKDYAWRAIGAFSIALVQLHVSVVTDPSKTKLDVQRWSTVELRGQPIDVTPYELLGAIFRTVVQYNFENTLEHLRAKKVSFQRPTKSLRSSEGSMTMEVEVGEAEVVSDDDDDGEFSLGRGASRKRKATTTVVALPADKTPPRKKAAKKVSKNAYTKKVRVWITKFREGKLAAETCIQRLEEALSTFE